MFGTASAELNLFKLCRVVTNEDEVNVTRRSIMKNNVKTANNMTGGGSIDRFLREIANEQPLAPEVEQQLAAESRHGDLQARDKLIRAHLKFVVSVARQYKNQGLPLQDLINEGNIGLVKAAEKFDETRGIRFISYAVWWIRQSIVQALAEEAGIMRMPVKQVDTHNKINRATRDFVQNNERWPSNEELAIMLDMSSDKVSESVNYGKPLSVDANLAQGENTTLLDVLVNDNAPMADGLLASKTFLNDLEQAIVSLDERQKKVVRMYFGIGAEQSTMAEIGQKLGLKRERVRQIRDKALRILRKTAKDTAIDAFIN